MKLILLLLIVCCTVYVNAKWGFGSSKKTDGAHNDRSSTTTSSVGFGKKMYNKGKTFLSSSKGKHLISGGKKFLTSSAGKKLLNAVKNKLTGHKSSSKHGFGGNSYGSGVNSYSSGVNSFGANSYGANSYGVNSYGANSYGGGVPQYGAATNYGSGAGINSFGSVKSSPKWSSGKQHICVEGQFSCSSKPERAHNIKLKLMDTNRFRRDTTMAEDTTDGQGRYHICGESSDPFGNIDPELLIYTQCNSHGFTCPRELRKPIEDRYIGDTYKLDLDLDIKLDSSYESHDCIH